MKRNIGENLFLAIAELCSAIEIAFSRESLSKKMLRMGGMDTRSFRRSLKRYENRGFIKGFIKHDRNYYQLTEKGYLKLSGLKMKRCSGSAQKKWDKRWRLVFFDVPEDRKYAREALRRRLKFFKFFPLQKSVFVFPYPCEKELRALGGYFKINDCLEIILTDSLGGKEEEAKDFFGL